jgi:hypothetical protein
MAFPMKEDSAKARRYSYVGPEEIRQSVKRESH